LLHSISDFSTEDLISELQRRGFNITSTIEMTQPKVAAVAGRKIVAFPRRE